MTPGLMTPELFWLTLTVILTGLLWVPYILNLSPDAVATPPTTDDYRLATACLEAVSRFVEEHGELFTTGPRERFEERSTIGLPGGDLEVVVT